MANTAKNDNPSKPNKTNTDTQEGSVKNTQFKV